MNQIYSCCFDLDFYYYIRHPKIRQDTLIILQFYFPSEMDDLIYASLFSESINISQFDFHVQTKGKTLQMTIVIIIYIPCTL